MTRDRAALLPFSIKTVHVTFLRCSLLQTMLVLMMCALYSLLGFICKANAFLQVEAVLEFSAREAAASSSSRVPSSSTVVNGSDTYSSRQEKKQELNGRISALEAELGDIDEQITKLKELRAQIIVEKQRLNDELQEQSNLRVSSSTLSRQSLVPSKNAQAGTINYMTEVFEWSGELRARMKEVFSIPSFRLCQEGYVWH